MKILVTGREGLPTLLAKELRKKGHVVLMERELMCGLTLNREYDAVFHVAATTDGAEENPVGATYVNVCGTIRALDAAKRNGVKRFVYVSTDSVNNIENVYALTKHLAEQACRYYSKYFPVTIVRLNYVYGKGTNKNRLIYKLFNKVISGVDIKVEDAWVKPTHVSDVTSFLVSCLREKNPSRLIVYSIGGNETTLRNLVLNIRFVVAEAKFKPKVGLREGLKEIAKEVVK